MYYIISNILILYKTPLCIYGEFNAMKSRLLEPTLYFNIHYRLLPWQWLWNNNFLWACPSKYLIEHERIKNYIYYIQARIQNIMFNRKVLQMICSAFKIILLLKWHHHKQNWMWNFVSIGTWVWSIHNNTN
jgi:hypothetical protein